PTVEEDEADARRRGPDAVAIGALQRRARHHDARRRAGDVGKLGADAIEPRPAVVVGERDAAPHAADARRQMERVAVDEAQRERSGDRRSDRRLARSRDPHDDDAAPRFALRHRDPEIGRSRIQGFCRPSVSTKATKPRRRARSDSATLASVSAPSASNTVAARGTRSRPGQSSQPSVRRIGSHAFWLRIVPNPPGDAPTSATRLPAKTRAASAGGRDSQSIAFLKTPGTELLYSGVASSRPSAAAIASFSSATARGTPSAASTSPS